MKKTVMSVMSVMSVGSSGCIQNRKVQVLYTQKRTCLIVLR